MYYLIKGTCNDEMGSTFDWIVEANSENEAKAMLAEGEECVEIREITVEERIEREENDFRQTVKWDYIYRRYSDCSVREFSKIQKQLETDPETYYKALVDFNKAQRFAKRLLRREGVASLTVAEYNNILNRLIDAKTEEEFNSILQSVDKE